MDEEGLTNTSNNKIFIGKLIDIEKEQLDKMIVKLYDAMVKDDNELIKDVVAEAVPTYVRKSKSRLRKWHWHNVFYLPLRRRLRAKRGQEGTV